MDEPDETMKTRENHIKHFTPTYLFHNPNRSLVNMYTSFRDRQRRITKDRQTGRQIDKQTGEVH